MERISRYDEEVPQLILPITRYKDQLHLFSDDSQCGALDFIYAKHLDKNYFKQVFILLKQHFPRYKFHINKVNERSKLAQYLLKDTEQQARITEKRTCVAINFGDNIDEYYHSLSKSTRQNLRTSFNKLIKNENTYSLKLCMGKNIDNKLLKEQLKLYNMRDFERTGHKKGYFQKLRQRYSDPITIATKSMDGSYSFNLYINGILAAFMVGLETNFNALVVPRLAINSEFAPYSPGKILIYESINYLISNSEIRTLDLSRGDERYKYDMGGASHYNYSFALNF